MLKVIGDINNYDDELSKEVTKRFKKRNPKYKGELRVGIRYGKTIENTLSKIKEIESSLDLKEKILNIFVEWAELQKDHVLLLYKNDSKRQPYFLLNEEVQKAWDEYHADNKKLTKIIKNPVPVYNEKERSQMNKKIRFKKPGKAK
jgi:hypothetical protein